MIQPGPTNGTIEQHYLAYGPLFTAMRGARWYLAPRPVSVSSGKADVNAMLLPAQQLRPPGAAEYDLFVPVVNGAPGSSVSLRLELDAAVGAATGGETFDVAVMLPGTGTGAGLAPWRQLKQTTLVGGVATVSVPLGAKGGLVLKVSLAQKKQQPSIFKTDDSLHGKPNPATNVVILLADDFGYGEPGKRSCRSCC